MSALLDVAQADPQVGMVGSRIAVLGRPNLTQEVGARIYWPLCRLIKLGAEEEYGEPGRAAAEVFDADYVAACSLLARVSAVENVGIWDEGYFVFFDDIEWGVRFTRAGWKVRATSASLIEHESFYERRLTHQPGAIQLCLRNALYFMHQFSPPLWRPVLLLWVFRCVLIDIAQHHFGGRREFARARRLGVGDFFRSLRGKSPHVFADDSPARLGSADGRPPASKIPSRKGRVLLWTVSGSQTTLDSIEAVRRSFPEHTLEIFVPSETVEVEDFELRGTVIRRPTRSFSDRLALARWALNRYDAIARHEALSRLLFERVFPSAVWFSDEGNVGVARNRWTDVAALVAARPLVWLGAAVLTCRALLKRRPHVDYFTWTRPSAGHGSD